MNEDIEFLTLSLLLLTKKLNELVGECTAENGIPKAPSRKALMSAKACLPYTVSNSFNARVGGGT